MVRHSHFFWPLLVIAALAAGASGSGPAHGGLKPVSDLTPFTRPDPARPRTPADRQAERFAPGSDRWTTEQLSDRALQVLKQLAPWLADPAQITAAQLADIIGEGFHAAPLRPKRLALIHEAPPIQVQRWEREDAGPALRGARGLAEALHGLTDRRPGWRASFKVVGIEGDADAFATRVRYEAVLREATTAVQRFATWHCRWTAPDDDDQRVRLATIELESFEEVTVTLPSGRLFVDATAAALRDTPGYASRVLTGINHWVPRVVGSGMSLFGYHGIAVGDANGDGLDDLYVCDADGLPNRLYLQRPDGRVFDASARMGVDFLDGSRSALFLDLDNDGDQDLVVAMLNLVLFLENEENRRFRPRYQHAIENSRSLCAADFDGDRTLDVYVCAYEPADDTGILPTPVPYHDANNGGANALLRNAGDFTFPEVTQRVGLNADNRRFTFAAAWEDYDRDGDLDLYVANDFGRNCLYRNDGARFENVAGATATEDTASGMSVAWGDVNRDGVADLYVGNMFSAAGNRVAFQGRFGAGRPGTLSDLRRMARGNTLYLGSTNGTFHDVSEEAGVTMGRWAWSSPLLDWNNDGWLDIVAANGFITNEDTGDL